MRLPVVEHEPVLIRREEVDRVDALADAWFCSRDDLRLPPDQEDLVPETIGDEAAFHLDDWSEIQQVSTMEDPTPLQDRARLRAVTGDVVAAMVPPLDDYEAYCQDCLGLGAVQWLHPRLSRSPANVATACWEDRVVRRKLLHALRDKAWLYLHPHMGTQAAWGLAALLRESSHRPVKVIAPPPGVTRLLNDKAEFANLVMHLFGPTAVPTTVAVWDAAHAAAEIRALSPHVNTIGVKLPSAAGGDGNLLVSAADLREHTLTEITAELKQLLPRWDWQPGEKLVVNVWRKNTIAAPSVQVWIPPRQDGEPVVEGLFWQRIVGRTGHFAGSQPVTARTEFHERITRPCWLLARFCQQLGYIGRCSFDLILVGESLDDACAEFVECNGRWGGTSLPMTLLNQVFGDWNARSFTNRIFQLPAERHWSFAELQRTLGESLFDRRTGQGHYIVYNPSRLTAVSVASIIALGDSPEEAQHNAEHFPKCL